MIKTLCGLYVAGLLLACFIFGRDAYWCHHARWPNLPFAGHNAGMHVFFPALIWPVFLPSAYLAKSANADHFCTLGGAWPNE
jgi:hypothetical protein